MSAETKLILYIEDDVANRQLVRFIVERRNGCQLREAEDGATGLQKAEKLRPDLILLDLSLPDISGYEVLKRLRQNPETITIPVIAVSGDNLPDDRQKGLKAGFTDYLGKPISVAGLNSAIDDILQKG